MEDEHTFLKLRRVGIDTHQQLVVFMRQDCHVASSEGFNAQGRVEVRTKENAITATLVLVTSEMLSHEEAALSEAAWRQLGQPKDGEKAQFRHAPPVDSMSCVRGKLYGTPFTQSSANSIIGDINAGRYSDIQMAAYVTACAGDRLSLDETIAITKAMVESGRQFNWSNPIVLDKHCVGGLPGNRTTPIVVAIVAANGLCMPKTSSRAITSPAGTADTMETLTKVQLEFSQMQQVVEQEGACLAWGGSVSLSPTDDMIIRIERALDLDSEGQLVASVISKKVAAGAKQVLIDIPVGPTAKVRSHNLAKKLADKLVHTGHAVGLEVRTIITDGSQPIGRGIGPALEAKDVLSVLNNEANAPQDLKEKSLQLAGILLEMGKLAKPGDGYLLAETTLTEGRAFAKFKQICQAQGEWKQPKTARYTHCIKATVAGTVSYFNNRFISRLASLAGAPNAESAGIELHVQLGDDVSVGSPLMTLHSHAKGELAYALDFLKGHEDVIRIEGEFE
ncbi:thymidine phosphorylase family protein [Bermanella sp. R86510]|uniref:thymidine phosphorylase family protein n=1 Tax=unclassified Bermanella TaxID=2627862 RepID=UPI0037C6C365